VLMFRARRLSPAWLARNHMALSTTARRDTCVTHFRTTTSRHNGVRADAATSVLGVLLPGESEDEVLSEVVMLAVESGFQGVGD
jgi:hypothetical protein